MRFSKGQKHFQVVESGFWGDLSIFWGSLYWQFFYRNCFAHPLAYGAFLSEWFRSRLLVNDLIWKDKCCTLFMMERENAKHHTFVVNCHSKHLCFFSCPAHLRCEPFVKPCFAFVKPCLVSSRLVQFLCFEGSFTWSYWDLVLKRESGAHDTFLVTLTFLTLCFFSGRATWKLEGWTS